MYKKSWLRNLLIGFCGTMIGSCALFGTTGQELSIVCEQMKTGAYDTELSDTDTGIQDDGLEEKELLYSTYLEYGEGCLFVTINKDMSGSNEDEADVTESETPNPDVSTVPAETKSSMENTGVSSSNALLNACLTEQEKLELQTGINKEIKVTFHMATEAEVPSEEVSSMNIALEQYEKERPGISFGNYVKIIFEKKNAMGEWEELEQLNGDVKLYLDVPTDFQTVSGTLFMLQVLNGQSSLHQDEDNYRELITFTTSGSSVYGLCCEEEIEEVIVTPEPTKEPTYWEKINSDELCIWHWFGLSFFVIGFTWVWAINRKKIRLVFLIIMSLIYLATAIMGSCMWDWILCGVYILLMLGMHIYKLKKK